MPDFVYFSHEIHVNKGLGCSSCHGRVDQMPLMYAQNTLQMEWCLDCHRNPAKNLRPTSQIYNMAWEAPAEERPVWCAVGGDEGRRADGAERELRDEGSGGSGAAGGVAAAAAEARRSGRGHAVAGGRDGRLSYKKFTSQDELGHFLLQQYKIRTPEGSDQLRGLPPMSAPEMNGDESERSNESEGAAADDAGRRCAAEAEGREGQERFWRSLDELAGTEEFEQAVEQEFPSAAQEWVDPVSRRGFMKLMGASMALAGLAGCTKQPDEPIFPYIKQPEDLILGKPMYFATAHPFPTGAVPTLVKATSSGRSRSTATRSTPTTRARRTCSRRGRCWSCTIRTGPSG